MICPFLHFLHFAVSSPGVRLSVVGFCSSISVFLGYILALYAVFICYELLILSYLLQMVEEEYGPGRL